MSNYTFVPKYTCIKIYLYLLKTKVDYYEIYSRSRFGGRAYPCSFSVLKIS